MMTEGYSAELLGEWGHAAQISWRLIGFHNHIYCGSQHRSAHRDLRGGFTAQIGKLLLLLSPTIAVGLCLGSTGKLARFKLK